MNSSPLKTVILITVTSATVIGGLYGASVFRTSNHSFTRDFRNEFSRQVIILPVKKNSYIAGVSNTQLFIGHKNSKVFHQFSFQNQTVRSWSIPELAITSDATLQIDSLHGYLMNGNQRLISYWNTTVPSEIHSASIFPFIQCLPLSPISYVMRTINSADENVLVKADLKRSTWREGKNLFEKQKEGLYSTAGMLHYSTTLHQLIYLYYYRNEYLLLDTLLTTIARGTTIDSNRYTKIKVVQITPGHYTLASPDAIVNRLSCVFENHLFVCSTARGKKENDGDHADKLVIDVYDLKSKRYIRSFYLYDYHHQKPLSFKVTDNRCIVVYKEAILIHTFKTVLSIESKEDIKNILPASRMSVSLVEK